MSAQFFVRFKAHIVESKRPAGFPKELVSDMVVQVNSIQELFQATNEQAGKIIAMQAFITQKDQNEPHVEVDPNDQSGTNLDKRILVPLHMISFIETETKRLTNQMPETGVKVELQ